MIHCLLDLGITDLFQSAFFKGVLDCAPINGRVFARGKLTRGLRFVVRLEIPKHETPILYKEPARQKRFELLSFITSSEAIQLMTHRQQISLSTMHCHDA